MSHETRRSADPDVPGLERVTLVGDEGVEAAFVPAAGMVGASLTLDGVELLARRQGLAGYLSRASTFGIPLLAPWANRLARPLQRVGDVAWEVRVGDPGVHADEFGQAIHGLAAGVPFAVTGSGADDGSAWLSAARAVEPSDPRFASFPFPHELAVRVDLRGRTLRVTTALTATADVAVPVAFGWHPWFAFPDVPRAAWEIDVPFRRRALLSDLRIPTGETVDDPVPRGALGDLVLDDVYVDVPQGAVAVVRAGDRSVSVRYVSGYDVGVVFAPGDAEVVCVEPMTAPTDPFSGRWPLRQVAPGEAFEAVFEVDVDRH